MPTDPFSGGNPAITKHSTLLLGPEKTGKSSWLLEASAERRVILLNGDNGQTRLTQCANPHNVTNIPSGGNPFALFGNLIAAHKTTSPVYLDPMSGKVLPRPIAGCYKIDWKAFPVGAVIALDSWTSIVNSITANFCDAYSIDLMGGDKLAVPTAKGGEDGLAYYAYAQNLQRQFMSAWASMAHNKVLVAHDSETEVKVFDKGVTKKASAKGILTVSKNQSEAMASQVRDILNFSISEAGLQISSTKKPLDVSGCESLPPFRCGLEDYPYSKYSSYLKLAPAPEVEQQTFITLVD